MFTVTKICFPCSFKKSQTIAADATCRNDFNIRIYRQERMKINALINLCCGWYVSVSFSPMPEYRFFYNSVPLKAPTIMKFIQTRAYVMCYLIQNMLNTLLETSFTSVMYEHVCSFVLVDILETHMPLKQSFLFITITHPCNILRFYMPVKRQFSDKILLHFFLICSKYRSCALVRSNVKAFKIWYSWMIIIPACRI